MKILDTLGSDYVLARLSEVGIGKSKIIRKGTLPTFLLKREEIGLFTMFETRDGYAPCGAHQQFIVFYDERRGVKRIRMNAKTLYDSRNKRIEDLVHLALNDNVKSLVSIPDCDRNYRIRVFDDKARTIFDDMLDRRGDLNISPALDGQTAAHIRFVRNHMKRYHLK